MAEKSILVNHQVLGQFTAVMLERTGLNTEKANFCAKSLGEINL